MKLELEQKKRCEKIANENQLLYNRLKETGMPEKYNLMDLSEREPILPNRMPFHNYTENLRGR